MAGLWHRVGGNMAEEEMSMNEILASIRQTLSEELDEKPINEKLDEELDDIFVLTPEMRCDDDHISLEARMRRVLEKMSSESIEQKKKTITDELQPLLREWMIRMRPVLSQENISDELSKILPSN